MLSADTPQSGAQEPESRSEAARKRFEQQILCTKCRFPATKTSVRGGNPACWRHDPGYVPSHESKKHRKEKKRLESEQDKVARERFLEGIRRGKRAAVLPDANLELYRTVIEDEDLVELRDDIATVESRIQQLLLALKNDPRDSSDFIRRVEKDIKKLVKLARSCGGAVGVEHLITLLHELEREKDKRAVWQEVMQATEMKRKLVETESRRMREVGWTPDFVHALLTEVSLIVKALVDAGTANRFVEALMQSPLLMNSSVRMIPKPQAAQHPDAAVAMLAYNASLENTILEGELVEE